jgi:hypothetical protein
MPTHSASRNGDPQDLSDLLHFVGVSHLNDPVEEEEFKLRRAMLAAQVGNKRNRIKIDPLFVLLCWIDLKEAHGVLGEISHKRTASPYRRVWQSGDSTCGAGDPLEPVIDFFAANTGFSTSWSLKNRDFKARASEFGKAVIPSFLLEKIPIRCLATDEHKLAPMMRIAGGNAGKTECAGVLREQLVPVVLARTIWTDTN